jgi:hypothetical protein
LYATVYQVHCLIQNSLAFSLCPELLLSINPCCSFIKLLQIFRIPKIPTFGLWAPFNHLHLQ